MYLEEVQAVHPPRFVPSKSYIEPKTTTPFYDDLFYYHDGQRSYRFDDHSL
jgi:hypothetical protein